MRFAGRITDWNDERGFGFVVPNGGGDRAFVHINEFMRGSRRPINGDLISYLAKADARGRLQAIEIRHAGQKIEARRQTSRFPRAAIGIGALLAVSVAAAIKKTPYLLTGWYLATSLVSWLMYYLDKRAAGRDARRTPESNLHLMDLLGGWPGALIAQQQFRHKTIKRSFQITFWLTVVVNLGAVWWLHSSGKVSVLVRMFNP